MATYNNFMVNYLIMEKNYDVSWMDEKIERFPNKNGFYRLLCLMLFKRRMTYSNMYVFSYALNKHRFKDNETNLKERILKDLALIYYYNTKKIPDGFEFEK